MIDVMMIYGPAAVAGEKSTFVSMNRFSTRPAASRPAQEGARLAVVTLAGEIEPEMAAAVMAKLNAAAHSDGVAAIALLVDSPGGQFPASAALAECVREAASRKPVFAHVGQICASGALFAVSHATAIAAAEWSSIGSLGTYLAFVDSSEMMRRIGLHVRVISSSEIKATGLPGTELTAEQQAYLTRRMTAVNEQFMAAVKSGRGLGVKGLIAAFSGEVWLARAAMEVGLIDAVIPFGDWFADLLRQYPDEQFFSLRGSAAIAKTTELLGGKTIAEADFVQREKVRERYPSLFRNAEAELKSQKEEYESRRRR